MDTHSRELEKEYGLTLPQLDVLWAVASSPGIPTGEVATQVHLSKATVTNITERLVKHGMLTRARAIADRRQVILHLTEEGRAILGKNPPPFHSRFIERLGQLPGWQQTEMLSVLQHVASLMEPAEG